MKMIKSQGRCPLVETMPTKVSSTMAEDATAEELSTKNRQQQTTVTLSRGPREDPSDTS